MMSKNFHPVSKRLSESTFEMMVAGCQLIIMKFCEQIKISCSGLCLPITHVYVVLYCMFQDITHGRTHGYVVHVSDAKC